LDLNFTNINGGTYNAPVGYYEIYKTMSPAEQQDLRQLEFLMASLIRQIRRTR